MWSSKRGRAFCGCTKSWLFFLNSYYSLFITSLSGNGGGVRKEDDPSFGYSGPLPSNTTLPLEGDLSSDTGVNAHIKKAPDTPNLNNLIEIIWSGFFHYQCKDMLVKVYVCVCVCVEGELTAEPQKKKGKSPGAKN